MNKFLSTIILCLTSTMAQANLITLELDEVKYQVGEQATLDVIASSENAVAEFAFILNFDSSALRYINAEFGDGLDLGDSLFGSWKNQNYDGINRLAIDEFSWFDNASLQTGQSASEILVSITFEILDVVTDGSFGFNLTSLTDIHDNGVNDSYQIQTAHYSAVDVPEPSTIFLFAMATFFIFSQRGLKHYLKEK